MPVSGCGTVLKRSPEKSTISAPQKKITDRLVKEQASKLESVILSLTPKCLEGCVNKALTNTLEAANPTGDEENGADDGAASQEEKEEDIGDECV